MEDIAISKSGRKKDWVLTQKAFRNLLDWLDQGADSSGERYLETRQRLVSYFDRKNCAVPEDMADETLNRVARRLEEEGAITDTAPPRYCYIIAKFVFLEYLRHNEHRQMGLEEVPVSEQPSIAPSFTSNQSDETQQREEYLNCLEKCLESLDRDSRELIVRYYQGEQRAKIENRRALAKQLSISINALSIKACRLRNRLESCVSKCVDR